MQYIEKIIQIATALISVSAGITAILPNKNEKGKRVHKIMFDILNIFALNVGNAKNKEQ